MFLKQAQLVKKFNDLVKTASILTFYGIRHSESNRRSNYEEITDSPKIAQQTVASPIIEWIDGDIWLYILSHGLDFNEAYRYGFTRVGCWCCPSNSLWSFYLTRVYYPELSEPWRDYLIDFTDEIGKDDAEDYIDAGKWKARQGGQEKTLVFDRACGDDPNAKTYELTKPISENMYEYFKPFGIIDRHSGRSVLNEVFVLERRTKEPVLILQGPIGSRELRLVAFGNNTP